MSDYSLYTPHFVQVYKSTKSRLPIEVWAKTIGEKLPYFKGSNNIYNTVNLSVKMSGKINDSDGIVNFQVSPKDSSWYSNLKSCISEMTGQPESKIDIVDYIGRPIKNMSVKQLSHAGELDVQHVNGQVIRTRQGVKVPDHMTTNKIATIEKWITDVKDTIASKVALSLKDCTMEEISKNTLQNGPVKKIIEDTLVNSRPDYNQFISDYAMDNISRKYMSVDEKTSAMAKSILFEIRSGLAASKKQIAKIDALKAAAKSGEKPLWADEESHIGKNIDSIDTHNLYLDICEDALYKPVVTRKLVHTIYRGRRSPIKSTTSTATISRRRKPVETTKINSGVEHPMTQFYKQHYYNKYGKYPGHVVDKFNKNYTSSTTEKPFVGDLVATKNAFLKFSGRHFQGSSNRSKHRLVPINSEMHSTRSKHRLVPIGTINSTIDSEMPRSKHRLVPIGTINSEMPKLVPINSEMPKLVPINSEMPKLVPIGTIGTKNSTTTTTTKNGHRLVPIGTINSNNRTRSRNTRSTYDSVQSEIDQEDFKEELFDGLPSFSSFLKGNK